MPRIFLCSDSKNNALPAISAPYRSLWFDEFSTHDRWICIKTWKQRTKQKTCARLLRRRLIGSARIASMKQCAPHVLARFLFISRLASTNATQAQRKPIPIWRYICDTDRCSWFFRSPGSFEPRICVTWAHGLSSGQSSEIRVAYHFHANVIASWKC